MSAIAILCAQPTNPLDLQRLSACCKPLLTGFTGHERIYLTVIELGDRPATFADEKLTGVWIFRVRTADKGVNRIEAMNEIRLNQKLQCAIYSWRRCPLSAFLQDIKNVVRADRLVAVPDQLQNLFPLGGKPKIAFPADSFCRLHRRFHAAGVVVGVSGFTAVGKYFSHGAVMG